MADQDIFNWEISQEKEKSHSIIKIDNPPLKAESKVNINPPKASFVYYKNGLQVNYSSLQNWFGQHGHQIMDNNFKSVDHVLYGWDGKHWKKADDYVKKYIFCNFKKIFGVAIDSKCMKELLEICKYVDFIPELSAWDWNAFYQQKIIVSFLNGTLVIDFTNQCHNFYPNMWNKKNNAVYVLSVNYNENMMEADYWKSSFSGRYFLDFYGDYEREQLQQFLAGILIPQFEIQQNLVILGDGGDGKGVLMGALRKLFGNVVTGLRVSEWQGKHDTTALVGSILNITSERPSREINVDIFKAIVANDEMQTNPKYKDLVYYKPFCKHIMTVNSLPAIEVDSAIMRRLVLIKTCKTTTLKNRTVTFKRDFELDKAGLVSFMLQGLFLLHKNNFSFLTGSPELQEELIYQNDSLVHDFMNACLDITDDANDYDISAYIYEIFGFWEKDHGKNSKPIVQATLSRKIITLAKSMGKVNVCSESRRVLTNRKTARILTGVTIKNNWKIKYRTYLRQLGKQEEVFKSL